VAYNQGFPVAEDELRTAGKAARVVLSTDRTTISAGSDVLIVTATAVDERGIRVPDANLEVEFTVSGPAQVVATDNGSIVDHEPFLLPHHHLSGGRAIAILRATSPGAIQVHAAAAGLTRGETQFRATPAQPANSVRTF
jgi:beta-galactosidase